MYLDEYLVLILQIHVDADASKSERGAPCLTAERLQYGYFERQVGLILEELCLEGVPR